MRSSRSHGACVLAALFALTPSTRAQRAVELPPGPLADAVGALLESGAVPPAPTELGPAWPAWSDHGASGWGGEEPWRRWVELLKRERAAAPDDPGRGARCASLALLAARQERGPEAWALLERAGDSPCVLAVLPALLPGLPEEQPAAGAPRLSPAVPPPAASDGRPAFADFVGQEMTRHALELGGATFSLKVVVEGDGVEVALVHEGGGPLELEVLPPVPPGVELGLVYADWAKVATERVPVAFTLSAEDPEHTLWARFRGYPEPWPAPASPDAAILTSAAPLVVVVPNALLDEPVLERFTEALSELFDRRAALATPVGAAQAFPGEALTPVLLHLGGVEGWRIRLAELVSIVERHALGPAAR